MKLSKLAQSYDKIAQARSEASKLPILATLLKKADSKTLEAIAHFTVGEVVEPRLTDRLGIGPGTIRNALADIRGCDPAEIEEAVKKSGDLGEVAARIVGGSGLITVADLWQRLNRVVKRNGDRQELLEHVFSNTDSKGAKYFTRILLNQLRIGVGYGTLTRAIAKAFGVEADDVERLYAMTSDIGLAATRARRGRARLRRARLTLFRPYRFMAAHKVNDPEDIFKALAGKHIIFEVKYDGARLQIHIKRASPLGIRLYSRRLNDDTESMPDVVAALGEAWKGGDAILEGEAVAYDRRLKKKQPFEAVLMRLGRKYDIENKAREIPLVLYLFDLLYQDGEDLMSRPQTERRERLGKLFGKTELVRLTESVVSDRIEDERKFFLNAVNSGHEGLMAKDPDAPYEPGKRTEYWMKLKPKFETLDVVVVGGIWGSGRRRGLLSSLVIAVRDKDDFKVVGKVGTGFSEELLADLTRRLEPAIISTRGRTVEIEPALVIEVDFQGIQKTVRYDSGYALRIPRFKRERPDKSIREADTLDRLKRLYRQY
jgi:DNA ligase 1